MAKIDLSQPLLDDEDKPMSDKIDGKDVPVLLSKALRRALLADVDGEGQPVRGEAKTERYELFLKIKMAPAGEPLELTPEELVLLRKVTLVYPTLVAGQIRAMLK
jgi:hypothetical protein